MATQVQLRRGTTAQNASFTGALGEVVVDTDKDTLVVHDGGTAGGFEISRADASNLKFPDGSVGSPAISFANDTNTGIYRGGSDILKFVTAGTDRLTIDASGVITSKVNGAVRNLDLNNEADTPFMTFSESGAVNFFVGESSIVGGGGVGFYDLYATTGLGQRFFTNSLKRMQIESNGDISFYEDTGSTPKLFWDSSLERLGIGTVSPATPIHTYSTSSAINRFEVGSTSDSGIRVMNTAGDYSIYTAGGSLRFADNNDSEVMRFSSGNVGIGITPTNTFHVGASGTVTTKYQSTDTGAFSLLQFQNTGSIVFSADHGNTQANSEIVFKRDGAQISATIDSSGNLLVGTTSINPADNNDASGSQLSAAGTIQTSASNVTPAIFNRGNDGGIIALLKAGVSVGSIGTASGWPFFSRSSHNTGLALGGADIFPVNTDGSTNDNAIDLGAGGARWKDLYLSGGVYLGGTGSANKLDDYEEGTWTPSVGGTATYNAQVGRYIKIGEFVWIQCQISINQIGTGSTTAISGVPFSTATYAWAGASSTYTTSLATSVVSLNPSIQGHAGQVIFLGRTSSSTSSTVALSVFGNSTVLYFSGAFSTI